MRSSTRCLFGRTLCRSRWWWMLGGRGSQQNAFHEPSRISGALSLTHLRMFESLPVPRHPSVHPSVHSNNRIQRARPRSPQRQSSIALTPEKKPSLSLSTRARPLTTRGRPRAGTHQKLVPIAAPMQAATGRHARPRVLAAGSARSAGVGVGVRRAPRRRHQQRGRPHAATTGNESSSSDALIEDEDLLSVLEDPPFIMVNSCTGRVRLL